MNTVSPLSTDYNLTKPPVQQKPGNSPKMISKPVAATIIVVFLIILVLPAIYIVLTLKNPQNNGGQSPTANPTTVPDVSDGKPYFGKKTIKLFDRTGGNSSGEVTRVRTIESISYKIRAKLPNPEEGSFYEAWISQKNGGFIISIGELTKSDNEEYALATYKKYDSPPEGTEEEIANIFTVSLEKEDDGKMEEVTLQGNFLKN